MTIGGVLSDLDNLLNADDIPCYYKPSIKAVMDTIALEQKKGHWIPVYQGDEIIDYRCSECEFGNTFGKGTFGMNFCPRCGSDNREVEE